jgi:hypothetical protein
MDDDEFLKERREAVAESIRYFASDRKPERELWVANRLLENLNIEHGGEELVHVVDDPPDVLFRDARFEVKEILDEGRRRHDEYRAALQKADEATSPSDLLTPFRPKDTSIQYVYDQVLSASAKYSAGYAKAVCQSLDLLLYVNLKDVMGLIEAPFPDVGALQAHPWRSVSFVMGARACVLTAADTAPAFLRQIVGRIVPRVGSGSD